MKPSTRATIAIPTHNRAPMLQAALNSVQELQQPPSFELEVLVIDNASTDHTPTVIEEACRSGPLAIRAVHEPDQGLNMARNRALIDANSEWIIFLDDDMLVDPGWLRGFTEAIDAYAPTAVVGPVEPWFEADPEPWLTPMMLDSVTSAYSRKGDTLHIVEQQRAHELPGCNFAVKLDAALQAGGFHPALDRRGAGMLAEGDFELGRNLVRLGRSTAYSPRCRIRHFVSKHKISREGLRDRWHGLGATRRVIEKMDGTAERHTHKIRSFLRMCKLATAGVQFGRPRDQGAAFDSELKARYLWGYLFQAPAIEPRRWPPIPLARQ